MQSLKCFAITHFEQIVSHFGKPLLFTDYALAVSELKRIEKVYPKESMLAITPVIVGFFPAFNLPIQETETPEIIESFNRHGELVGLSIETGSIKSLNAQAKKCGKILGETLQESLNQFKQDAQVQANILKCLFSLEKPTEYK